jgi:hypothetical protein
LSRLVVLEAACEVGGHTPHRRKRRDQPGLTVANSHGFFSPNVFRLETSSTKIDARSITSSHIVIDEIHISSPQVVYEINQALASNILVLKKNIQKSATASKKKASKKNNRWQRSKNPYHEACDGQRQYRGPWRRARGQAPGRYPKALRNDQHRQNCATPAKIAADILTTLVEEVGISIVRIRLEKK